MQLFGLGEVSGRAREAYNGWMRIWTGLLLAAISCWGVEYKDGYADSGGVKIHYVTAGQGPLVVMIHGFPDFWGVSGGGDGLPGV
jgi:hypothetical protein